MAGRRPEFRDSLGRLSLAKHKEKGHPLLWSTPEHVEMAARKSLISNLLVYN